MQRSLYLRGLRVVAAYFISLVLVVFGMSKVMGIQFILKEEHLKLPIGEAKGMLLVWAYFHYSYGYTAVVGGLQILAGVAILFSRTRLAGLLLALTLFSNIVLVNWFFGVEGAKIHATAELMIVLALLIPYAKPIYASLLKLSTKVEGRGTKLEGWLAAAFAIILLADSYVILKTVIS